MGFGVRWPFPSQLCSVPGELFDGVLNTVPDPKGGRTYVYELTSGPAVGNVYMMKDVYDAVSVMDQVLWDNGHDISYTDTSDFRDSWKSWLIENWIDADAFYLAYGY